MATDEILPVKKVGNLDGDWGVFCPHCKQPIGLNGDPHNIDDIRGEQFQHSNRDCGGWFEIDSDAQYDRKLFDSLE